MAATALGRPHTCRVSHGQAVPDPMTIRIGVVWNRPNDRLWLLRLREWASRQSVIGKFEFDILVEPLNSVIDAIRWRDEAPAERFVVAAGFLGRDIAVPSSAPIAPLCEPVLILTPDPVPSPCTASASFFDRRTVIECDEAMLWTQMRKSLLRAALSSCIEIRSPTSDADLSAYFALRYRVWDAVGFLTARNRLSSVKWELDYADRTSIPVVAVSTTGQTVGCVRLVRNLGQEEAYYVSHIRALIGRSSDPTLTRLFEYPHALVHPFDILEEFPGFRTQFSALIKARSELAEISRVIVAPEHRGFCIAEALVDSAVSIAERQRVLCLFLACHEVLQPLYAKSLFQPVEGLRSSKFFNISLPSIVMNRYLNGDGG